MSYDRFTVEPASTSAELSPPFTDTFVYVTMRFAKSIVTGEATSRTSFNITSHASHSPWSAFTVISSGQSSSGAVVSSTWISCTHVLVLPESSVAVHVRVLDKAWDILFPFHIPP